jgi:ketosteroid isomerase-like protein
MSRRKLLQKGAAGAAFGVAALAVPGLARAGSAPDSRQMGGIYELQAAFHHAKSHQDIELMTSLWTDNCTFTYKGATYNGPDAVRAFFLASGSFLHRRMSLVPSFKDQIVVGHNGDHAFLYFECHDIALDANDPGGPARSLVTHLTNYGLIKKRRGRWQFDQMHFGSAAPISVDTIYDT